MGGFESEVPTQGLRVPAPTKAAEPALMSLGPHSFDEPQHTYIYVTHSCLFVVAVDEQHLIVCWLGLEVLNFLSSFLKLSLKSRERRGLNRAQ